MRQNEKILFLYGNIYKNNFIYYHIIMEEELLNKIKKYEEEIKYLKERLETYSHSQKEYYQKNKHVVNEKSKERMKKIAQENPDKLKEINRKAYLKRKEKLKNLENK